MSFYIIDFNKLAKERARIMKRKPKRLAWTRVLVSGVKNLYVQFLSFRTERLYYLSHNSQVCYMEAALNDMFDNTLRRIYISDGPYEDPVYLYLDSEEAPVYLAEESELPVGEYEAPTYLPTDVETAELGYQFIVNYPDGLVFDVERMKALINRYRLPSKWNYSIVSYEP